MSRLKKRRQGRKKWQYAIPKNWSKTRVKKVKWPKTPTSPQTHTQAVKQRLSGTGVLALCTPALIADWRQLHRKVALKAEGEKTHTGKNQSGSR